MGGGGSEKKLHVSAWQNQMNELLDVTEYIINLMFNSYSDDGECSNVFITQIVSQSNQYKNI